MSSPLSIVVVCKRPDDAKDVVLRLSSQLSPEDELLVVSSCEGELEGASRVIVVDDREKCSNVGEVRDIALRKAEHDLLLFVDSDCVPDKDFVHRARVASSLMRDEIICIGGPVLPHERTFISQYFERSLFSPFPREKKEVLIRRERDLFFHHHPNTSNLLIDRRKALEVGGFRGGRGEDLDFILRSLRKYWVMLSPLLMIEHEHPKKFRECLKSFAKLGGSHLRTLMEHKLCTVVVKRALLLGSLILTVILGILAFGTVGILLPYAAMMTIYLCRRCGPSSFVYPALDFISLLAMAAGGASFLLRCYQHEASKVVSPVS